MCRIQSVQICQSIKSYFPRSLLKVSSSLWWKNMAKYVHSEKHYGWDFWFSYSFIWAKVHYQDASFLRPLLDSTCFQQDPPASCIPRWWLPHLCMCVCAERMTTPLNWMALWTLSKHQAALESSYPFRRSCPKKKIPFPCKRGRRSWKMGMFENSFAHTKLKRGDGVLPKVVLRTEEIRASLAHAPVRVDPLASPLPPILMPEGAILCTLSWQ